MVNRDRLINKQTKKIKQVKGNGQSENSAILPMMVNGTFLELNTHNLESIKMYIFSSFAGRQSARSSQSRLVQVQSRGQSVYQGVTFSPIIVEAKPSQGHKESKPVELGVTFEDC